MSTVTMPEGLPSVPESSTGLGKLAAALAKAQGEMRPAKKDSENPFFHSSYADLAAIWEACREPLAKHDLAVAQWVHEGHLVTSLIHSSGQQLDSRMAIAAKKDDVQSLGSTLTYLRRYALAALVGVVAEGEDDDGNAGAGRESKPAVSRPAAVATAKPKPVAAPAPGPKPVEAGPEPKCPACGTLAKKQAYPKPGLTHFCPACAHAFEPSPAA